MTSTGIVDCNRNNRNLNREYYRYSALDNKLSNSEAISECVIQGTDSDVDGETSVINDSNCDIKLAEMEMISEGLDEHSDSEQTMSTEGHCDGNPLNPDGSNKLGNLKHELDDYCCECHCTRTYQQRDPETFTSNLNSHCDNRDLHQLHQHSIGVENNINLVTILKLSGKYLTDSEIVKPHHSDSRQLTRSSSTVSECKIKLRCSERLNNTNMALILGFSTTFIVLLCLCGVVLMMNQSAETKYTMDSSNISNSHYAALLNSSKHLAETTTEPRIIKDLPYISVSKDEFESHLANSNSAGDLLKIFFSDQSLTAEQVNSIIHMKTYYITAEKKDPDYSDDYMDTDTVLQRNPGADDSERARELALQHNKEVNSHPFSECKDPHPELVPVELPSDDAVRYIYPKCTLLHRCRNTTGCCGTGKVCAPRDKDGIQLIDRHFLVLEESPGSGGIRPTQDLVIAKTFVNHTACECKPIEIETNCRKECPRQFVKRRADVNCQCVCRTGIRHCKQVIRGLAPLEEDGLACIKEGKCIVPECQSGKFMIQTGYCPPLRRHGHGRKHRKRRG